MSDAARSLRWRSLDGSGLEHAVIKPSAVAVSIEGVAIGGSGPDGFGLRYRIAVDPEWTAFRALSVTLLGGPTVALRHDGFGVWTDGEGKLRKDLADCLDADFRASPVTLAATLRRQAWKAGRVLDLDVVAVTLPGLAIARGKLRIACDEPGRRYRVIGETGEEAVEMGEDGLVEAWRPRFLRDPGGAAG
jgi:hypothetical protein